jgi:RNA polymerase sigma-70 factor (ECF subfamily)
MHMSDQELVNQTIAGDAHAYRQLVEKYQQPLLRYVTFLLRDSTAAEDAVQDTFIKAYRNLRGYNPAYKFSSWLYRIAHNAAMDSLPRHHQVSLNADDINAEQHTAFDPDTAEKLDREFASKHVAACLAKLEVKYREPIALAYLDHKSYDEISDVLHISVSAIGVRINRAKQKLKAICVAMGVRHE